MLLRLILFSLSYNNGALIIHWQFWHFRSAGGGGCGLVSLSFLKRYTVIFVVVFVAGQPAQTDRTEIQPNSYVVLLILDLDLCFIQIKWIGGGHERSLNLDCWLPLVSLCCAL